MAASVALAGAAAAAEFDDPEWPCVQRKVPELSIGQMWAGPVAEAEPDAAVVALAAELAPRRVEVEAVAERAGAVVDGLPEAERAARLGAVFAAILDRINAERAELIAGIGRYARSQTALSEAVEARQRALAELEAAPEASRDLDRIEELRDTLAWDTRIFRERAQSLTYVCETPVLLEQRAFAVARALGALM